MLGWRNHFIQHAVDAVAHLELMLEGLEMDVRCAITDRLEQYEVQQLDDLIVTCRVHDRVEVDRLVRVLPKLRELVVARDRTHRIAQRGVLGEMLIEQGID